MRSFVRFAPSRREYWVCRCRCTKSDGMPVGELRNRLELPAATLTAHLNVLRAAGLVTDQREGRVIRVRADYARMNALIAYLTENCCAGSGTCGPVATCKPSKKGSK